MCGKSRQQDSARLRQDKNPCHHQPAPLRSSFLVWKLKQNNNKQKKKMKKKYEGSGYVSYLQMSHRRKGRQIRISNQNKRLS